MYYVDVRGIISSFGKFMRGVKQFVSDEYIIRPTISKDIEEWENDNRYSNDVYSFLDAVIKEF